MEIENLLTQYIKQAPQASNAISKTKNENLSNKDLYSIETQSAYYYSKGWHIKGVYSIILGFIFSASTIWNTNIMFLQSYSWIIGAFISLVTYYLLAKK